MYEMHREGALEKGLIDRSFTYDVMLHTAFQRGSVQPGNGWTADSMTRYHRATGDARVAGAASPDAEPYAMVQPGMQQLYSQGASQSANRGGSDYHDVLEHRVRI